MGCVFGTNQPACRHLSRFKGCSNRPRPRLTPRLTEIILNLPSFYISPPPAVGIAYLSRSYHRLTCLWRTQPLVNFFCDLACLCFVYSEDVYAVKFRLKAAHIMQNTA